MTFVNFLTNINPKKKKKKKKRKKKLQFGNNASITHTLSQLSYMTNCN